MLTDGALANSFPLICHCQALFMPSSIDRLFYPLNLCDDKYFCCKHACRCASMFSPQNDWLVRYSDLELCHRQGLSRFLHPFPLSGKTPNVPLPC